LVQRTDYLLNFRIELLAPDGVAVATNYTNNSFDNISSSPYTNDILVGGSANPEPLITLTLDSTGGGAVNNIAFLNRTTNESISITTAFNSDDVIQIDTKNKQVLYNTRAKRFTGLLPQFQLGTNRFKVDVETSGTLHQSQTDSDNARSIFGNTYLSQRINPDTAISVSQIELLLKKTEATETTLETYDDFNDDTRDTDKWTYIDDSEGTPIAETGGQAELYPISTGGQGQNHEMFSDDKTGGETSAGVNYYVAYSGGAIGGTHKCEFTDGTNRIDVWIAPNDGKMSIVLTGSYGSGTVATWDGLSGIIDIKQEGADILIKCNGSLKYTISGKTIATDSFFRAKSQLTVAGSYGPKLAIDNVKFYQSSSASVNTDMIVEIQTDSGGDPSGTAVTNGSTTIKAADISETYTIIPATFANTPSLSDATDYHIVCKQTGGDANNYYSAKIYTSGGYSQGEVSTSTDAGSNWTDQTEDMWFKLYGAFATDFNLDLDIDYLLTHYSLS